LTSDLDIFRTANVLVKHYGEDADLEAAQRADAMLEKGAIDGQRVWKRVLAAVKEIQREEPREGEAVNRGVLTSCRRDFFPTIAQARKLASREMVRDLHHQHCHSHIAEAHQTQP